MKTFYKLGFTLITLSLLMAACGEKKKNTTSAIIASENIAEIEAKRSELMLSLATISKEIDALGKALETLDTTQKKALVSVVTIRPKTFEHYTEVQGTIKTDQNMLVGPEYGGKIMQVLVQQGTSVRKGQVLAKIEDGGLADQLKGLQIQYKLAKTTFERQQKLWDQKIGSEIQFLQAKTAYQTLQQNIKQLEDQLEKTKVHAPFNGIVDQVMAEVGMQVAPGSTPLFRVINTQKMYVEAEVPENYLTAIQKGTKVKVFIPVLNDSLMATVTQKGKHINPENRSFRIEVALANPNEKLSPNLNARIKINDYRNENALLVPQSIISENANEEEYVFVATRENKAQKVLVKTGRSQGDFIEIEQGLEAGQSVIVEGARSVAEGQPLNIIK